MIRDVVVLCWDGPQESDRNAHKIAAFLGARPRFFALTPAALDGASFRTLVPRCTCLIVDAATLAQAGDAGPLGVTGLLSLIAEVADRVFVYGFEATDRHGALLQTLTSGGLAGVQPLRSGETTFHVAEGYRESCGQFTGLSMRVVDPARESRFVEGPTTPQHDVMIRAGVTPFFVRTQHGRAQLFLLACGELADLDETVRSQARPMSWFSRLIPLMMFLRGALGDRVWHNDNPRACFIIDDPALKRRYGFLEFGRLIESMRRHRFSTCIAFIPWNHRRSSDAVAALFSSTDGAPGLCVHGCDHTRGEFASTDVDSLRGKARLALERMRAHSRRSGVPFDDVMVFPQGLFSAEAIAALKDAGYLAAVNSDVCPSTLPDTLTLRDLLRVAVTRFADFPLFGRRYPRDLEDFAFDLFMGKPALAVEHHGYFREGYAELESFVERLKSLDERLEWADLGTICSRACLVRTEGGDVHVRFFTNRFVLKNTGARSQTYVLRRRASDGPLPTLTVDGRAWPCEREDGYVNIRLSLDAGRTADIRLSWDRAGSVTPPSREADAPGAKVRIRRLLSEFRDNYVDTNRLLNAIVVTARNFQQSS